MTDGEFRRWMFLNSFYDAVEGVPDRTTTVAFRNDRGEDVPLSVHEIVGSSQARRLAGRPRGGLHGRGGGRSSVQGHLPGAVDLRPPVLVQARRQVGATARSRSSWRTRSRSSAVSSPTRSPAGARYVQFDFPLYPYLVDPAWIDAVRGRRARRRHAARRGDRRGHRGPGGHPGRRDDRAPHLPRQLPLVLDVRGLARSRSPIASSASCRTTRSSSNGTTWGGTAASSRCGSCATAR